jgi:hypothetical protein
MLASNLEEIRRKTENLQLGGLVFSNAEHLRMALRKLEFHRARSGCLCALYPEYIFYNPQQEEAAGNVVIEQITYSEGNWIDAYFCACTVCGQQYRVEEGEYHYTWWGWKPEPRDSVDVQNARD